MDDGLFKFHLSYVPYDLWLLYVNAGIKRFVMNETMDVVASAHISTKRIKKTCK